MRRNPKEDPMTTTLPLADIPTTRPTAASAPTTGLRTFEDALEAGPR